MFKLRRTCKTCPFRKDQGKAFGLHPERLMEIIWAPAFQCHSTVDYDAEDEDGEGRAGDAPQQCAGLMSLLHREGRPNQIMQVAERLGSFNPEQLVHDGIYDNLAQMMRDHTGETLAKVRKRLSQLFPPQRSVRSAQQMED